jgi:beta-lactamase regulating signal transducer with metallopeptidase domain
MVAINWLSREETVALGWTLVHFLWQGAAIALAYAILDRMTRRASPAVRYLVALGAFALMPLAVIATFANEMRNSSLTTTIAQPKAPVSRFHLDETAITIAQDLPTAAAPAMNRPRAWLADHLEPALPWVDDLWMIGVSLLALRAMGGWYHLQALKKRARWTIPADLAHQFHQISRQMRLARNISLRISEEVISPLAMGAWRATVILPVSAVLRMPPSELEAVLAHELAHIRRFDYLCNLFQTAVESVLFFHPAIWWLSRTVRDRREVCCDEIAVAVCADPIVYAQALLRLEEEKTTRLQLAVALKGPNGSLLRRVKLVLGDGPNGPTSESRAASGVRVAAAAILVMGLFFGPRVRNVVAAPLITVSQTAFSHATPTLALIVKPQSPATPVKAIPKSEDAGPANVAVIPIPAPDVIVTPTPAPDVNAKVNVNATASSDVVVADEATSINLSLAENLAQSSGTGESQGAGESHSTSSSSSSKTSTYIESMRAAGYPLDLNNDLDTLIALKSLGVTPEYAKSMAATGLGKPDVHDLIAMKSLGVTPEYLASLKQSGLGPKDLNEAVSLKALGVTPEYAAGMKQAGFTDLRAQELIALKAQGMTPEHAKWLKQQFPQATAEEMQRAAVFHIDDKFIAEAKSHGFDTKDLDKLLRLKMSGLLDN